MERLWRWYRILRWYVEFAIVAIAERWVWFCSLRWHWQVAAGVVVLALVGGSFIIGSPFVGKGTPDKAKATASPIVVVAAATPTILPTSTTMPTPITRLSEATPMPSPTAMATATPTVTPLPPAATPVPPTATPLLPTATPMPPTATPVTPTPTSLPPALLDPQAPGVTRTEEFTLRRGVALIKLTHEGRRNFVVDLVPATPNTRAINLVSELGPFQGTVQVVVTDEGLSGVKPGRHYMNVKADGVWTWEVTHR